MKKTSIITLISFAIAYLTGCATMSVEECKIADWESVGYKDGKAGQDKDYLLKHQKSCAKADIAPNKQAWETGRQQGLMQYCTADNAFALGKAGSHLNPVCPSQSLSQLQAANENGLMIYRLQRQIKTDIEQRDKLLTDYKKLRNGENLDFKNEKDARSYLSELPYKINNLTQRINQNTAILTKLGY